MTTIPNINRTPANGRINGRVAGNQNGRVEGNRQSGRNHLPTDIPLNRTGPVIGRRRNQSNHESQNLREINHDQRETHDFKCGRTKFKNKGCRKGGSSFKYRNSCCSCGCFPCVCGFECSGSYEYCNSYCNPCYPCYPCGYNGGCYNGGCYNGGCYNGGCYNGGCGYNGGCYNGGCGQGGCGQGGCGCGPCGYGYGGCDTYPCAGCYSGYPYNNYYYPDYLNQTCYYCVPNC